MLHKEIRNISSSMMLDGRSIAQLFLAPFSSTLRGKRLLFIVPGGMDHAAYLARKEKAAAAIGVETTVVHVATPAEARAVIAEQSPKVDGIVVQLPFPDTSWDGVLDAIPPSQDPDCLTTINRGKLAAGTATIFPPIAIAVDAMLAAAGAPLATDQHAVIIGAGYLIGAPLAATWAGRKQHFDVITEGQPLTAATLHDAKVIVTGIGRPWLLTPDLFPSDAIVIDAGTTPTPDGLRGDVDPATADHVRAMAPVPGGVGPVVIAALLANLRFCSRA